RRHCERSNRRRADRHCFRADQHGELGALAEVLAVQPVGAVYVTTRIRAPALGLPLCPAIRLCRPGKTLCKHFIDIDIEAWQQEGTRSVAFCEFAMDDVTLPR